MKDKKKVIISVIAIIVLLVIIFAIIINKRVDTAMKKNYEILPEVELSSEVFENEDINALKGFKVEKASDISLSSKYIVGSNSYIAKADVKLENRTGKLIFLRDGYNKVNIYQTKYGIDELDSISSQVSRYMEEFKMNCTMIMGAGLDEPTNSVLVNKDDSDKNIPLEESIFNHNRLYSLTYNIKEDSLLEDNTIDSSNARKYEINFYRNGSYLMCEFVKVF